MADKEMRAKVTEYIDEVVREAQLLEEAEEAEKNAESGEGVKVSVNQIQDYTIT